MNVWRNKDQEHCILDAPPNEGRSILPKFHSWPPLPAVRTSFVLLRVYTGRSCPPSKIRQPYDSLFPTNSRLLLLERATERYGYGAEVPLECRDQRQPTQDQDMEFSSRSQHVCSCTGLLPARRCIRKVVSMGEADFE